VERAAVLDLDKGPRSIGRRPLIEVVLYGALFEFELERLAGTRLGRAIDGRIGRWIDARQRRRRLAVGLIEQESKLGEQPVLRFVVVEASFGSAAASDPGSMTTEQPVTRIRASGFARLARRTAWRDLRSAMAVTVQC